MVLDNRPFNFPVKAEYYYTQPDKLPVCVIDKIYREVMDNKSQVIKDKYKEAFQTTVFVYHENNLISVRPNEIVLTDKGQRKDFEVRAKGETLGRIYKFREWMEELQKETLKEVK